MSLCPVDSLSEVISRKRVALVQLGVIVSLWLCPVARLCFMAALYFTMIALTHDLEAKEEGSRLPQLPLRA